MFDCCCGLRVSVKNRRNAPILDFNIRLWPFRPQILSALDIRWCSSRPTTTTQSPAAQAQTGRWQRLISENHGSIKHTKIINRERETNFCCAAAPSPHTNPPLRKTIIESPASWRLIRDTGRWSDLPRDGWPLVYMLVESNPISGRFNHLISLKNFALQI